MTAGEDHLLKKKTEEFRLKCSLPNELKLLINLKKSRNEDTIQNMQQLQKTLKVSSSELNKILANLIEIRYAYRLEGPRKGYIAITDQGEDLLRDLFLDLWDLKKYPLLENIFFNEPLSHEELDLLMIRYALEDFLKGLIGGILEVIRGNTKIAPFQKIPLENQISSYLKNRINEFIDEVKKIHAQ